MKFRVVLCIGLVTVSAAGAVSAQSVPVEPHASPEAALHSQDPKLAANKRLVFDMWRNVVNAGRVEAADEMLAEGYIQHSPVLRTGRSAFKQIFSVVPRRPVPDLVEPPLVASIAERDLVIMSLLERLPAKQGDAAVTTTHFNLFRVADGRLAEHWHSVRSAPGPDVPLPEDGGPQPARGAVGSAQERLLQAEEPRLRRNKRLVFDLWRVVVEAGREQLAPRYVGARFIEHSPGAGTGIDGLRKHFSKRADRPVQRWIQSPVVAIMAEGDLVGLVTVQELPHPHRAGRTYTLTWFNLFRIADGRVVEHWDAATPQDPPSPLGW
jgi:predicted SnoaL-like aldol condensation-catalyzing enzyme